MFAFIKRRIENMKKIIYTITDPEGIHARPAGLLVKKAKEYISDIKIIKDEKTANLKTIFAIMGLGVKTGQEVVIIAEGEDEEKAITDLEAFFKENL